MDKELQAQELRIGSLVYGHGDIPHFIDPKNIWEYWLNNKYFKPIPLTPEWLERMGFELNVNTSYSWTMNPETNEELMQFKLNDFLGYHTTDGGTFIGGTRSCFIKYVHQLQNLYSALTGQELEVKELDKTYKSPPYINPRLIT